MNSHFQPEDSSVPTPPEVTNEQLRIVIANIFLYRRQGVMSCSWHVPLGIPMNSIALHTYLSMQVFHAVATRLNVSRAAIAEGLLLFLNHDVDEIVTTDRNIYSAPFLKVDAKSAMLMLQQGHPFQSMNMEIHEDYELAKKGQHTDKDLNTIGTLLKDIDGFDRPLEQLEKVARDTYPKRRWRREEVQAENTYKAKNYNYDLVQELQNYIIAKDLTMFDPPKTDDDNEGYLHKLARDIFKRRMEQFYNPADSRVWPMYSIQRHSKALQTYFRMQIFVVLAQLTGLNRANIAEGLFKLILHETRNTSKHPRPPSDILIGNLIEDACQLEEMVELLELSASTPKVEYRWTSMATIAAHARAKKGYKVNTAKRLHQAIEDYGLDAYDDAFLRLPNAVKSGTHGVYTKP